MSLQEMSTKFLGEIRAERICRFLVAEIAFVNRLARMQIRGQHVLPEILLET